MVISLVLHLSLAREHTLHEADIFRSVIIVIGYSLNALLPIGVLHGIVLCVLLALQGFLSEEIDRRAAVT